MVKNEVNGQPPVKKVTGDRKTRPIVVQNSANHGASTHVLPIFHSTSFTCLVLSQLLTAFKKYQTPAKMSRDPRYDALNDEDLDLLAMDDNQDFHFPLPLPAQQLEGSAASRAAASIAPIPMISPAISSRSSNVIELDSEEDEPPRPPPPAAPAPAHSRRQAKKDAGLPSLPGAEIDPGARDRRARSFCFTVNNPRGQRWHGRSPSGITKTVDSFSHPEKEQGKKYPGWTWSSISLPLTKEEKMSECVKLVERLISKGCSYAVSGFETGDSGTDHLQGYLYVGRDLQKTFAQIKEMIGMAAHITALISTPRAAAQYCKKDKIFAERGEIPVKGKRTDIDDVVDALEDGASSREIAQKYPAQYIKYGRGIEQLLTKRSPAYTDQRKVWWFYGPTGSGKSHTAQLQMEKLSGGKPIYFRKGSSKWWNNYEEEEFVIIDDISLRDSNGGMTFAELLHITDKYGHTVETKGGFRQLKARFIIITCDVHPNEAVSTTGDKAQLIRRINGGIIKFKPRPEALADVPNEREMDGADVDLAADLAIQEPPKKLVRFNSDIVMVPSTPEDKPLEASEGEKEEGEMEDWDGTFPYKMRRRRFQVAEEEDESEEYESEIEE